MRSAEASGSMPSPGCARLQRWLIDRHGDHRFDGRLIGCRGEARQLLVEQLLVDDQDRRDFDVLAGDVLEEPDRVEDGARGDLGGCVVVGRQLGRDRVDRALSPPGSDRNGRLGLLSQIVPTSSPRRPPRSARRSARRQRPCCWGRPQPTRARRPRRARQCRPPRRCRSWRPAAGPGRYPPPHRRRLGSSTGCCAAARHPTHRSTRDSRARASSGAGERLGVEVGLATLGAFVLGHGPTPSSKTCESPLYADCGPDASARGSSRR